MVPSSRPHRSERSRIVTTPNPLDHGSLRQALEAAGLRATPQRLAVVGALVDARNHPSAEDLFARVRETCPTTSRATVYKTLDTLKEIGEVLELEFRDGSNRYDGVRPQSHPHLVCTRCGQVDEVASPAVARGLDGTAAEAGFVPLSRSVELEGECSACRAGA